MFQSGGCYILNKKFDIMKNGDSINSNTTYRGWCQFMDGDGTFPMVQSNITLPFPKKDSFYLSFNLDAEYNFLYKGFIPAHLFYHIIDMRQENGLGAVVEKKKIAIQDTLSRGHITMTKHSNNTDWWIIVAQYLSNCIFTVQVTPDGVKPPQKICVGKMTETADLGSQVAVSLNGKKYARTFSVDSTFVYDFDNTTGIISNQIKLNSISDSIYGAFQGCVFSPNSRYLYITRFYKVFQFDMAAKDIQASRVLVGDYTDYPHDNPDKGYFFSCHLGPDGKIYIASPFSHLFISTINRPNCPGKLCDFRAYSIELAFYNYGALSNTAYFETPPANYNCDSITATENISEQLYIYPNPASMNIIISSTYDFKTYEIVNMTGQKLVTGSIKGLSDENIDVSGLTNGIYILRLTNEVKERLAIKKFSVIHR